jgi:hypothetical protein
MAAKKGRLILLSRWAPATLVAVACGAAPLLLSLQLRWFTQRELQSAPRMLVSLSSIDCPTPSGQTREDFLSEVRYQASLPTEMNRADPDFASRLAAAFAEHAWVERVHAIQPQANGRIRAELTFREPALTVVYDGASLVVDRHGVLLPRRTKGDGLPIFRDRSLKPPPIAGKSWGDPRIQQAASAAARR